MVRFGLRSVTAIAVAFIFKSPGPRSRSGHHSESSFCTELQCYRKWLIPNNLDME